MDFTRDRLLRAGAELSRLTSSEAFQTAVEILRADISQRILTTSLGDQWLRESLYNQSVALDELLGTINTLAYAAENENNSDNEN